MRAGFSRDMTQSLIARAEEPDVKARLKDVTKEALDRCGHLNKNSIQVCRLDWRLDDVDLGYARNYA